MPKIEFQNDHLCVLGVVPCCPWPQHIITLRFHCLFSPHRKDATTYGCSFVEQKLVRRHLLPSIVVNDDDAPPYPHTWEARASPQKKNNTSHYCGFLCSKLVGVFRTHSIIVLLPVPRSSVPRLSCAGTPSRHSTQSSSAGSSQDLYPPGWVPHPQTFRFEAWSTPEKWSILPVSEVAGLCPGQSLIVSAFVAQRAFNGMSCTRRSGSSPLTLISRRMLRVQSKKRCPVLCLLFFGFPCQ